MMGHLQRAAAVAAAALTFAAALASPAPAQRPDSLELVGWLSLARARSPALLAAEASVREAESLRGVAGSVRGPRFEAGGLYLRFEDDPALDLGPGGAFAPVAASTYLARLGVAQPLYTSGRVSASVRAAERGLRAAEAWAVSAEVELTVAVARAYDDVLVAGALEDVARRSVQALEEAVRVAGQHFDAGAVARLDVLRAETRLASARSGLRSSATAVATARERLAAITGVHPDSAPSVMGALEYAETVVDSAALLERARSGRPDVQALHAAAGAERARAAGAAAERRPVVGLYATAFGSSPEVLTGRDGWSWRLVGGVTVSWPFFDSGEASARSRAARAQARAAQTVDAAAAAVRAALRELGRAGEDVQTGRANVARAERALEIARARYADGLGIQLEVLEAEADLTVARVDLLRAIHAYRSAGIELRRAAGLPADAPLSVTHPAGERGGGGS